jgi:hypothetical protein
MTYEWQIQPGDEVKVFPSDDDQVFYRGIVKYMPQATGDSWIIDATGVITYQQTFNRIVLVKKGESDVRF